MILCVLDSFGVNILSSPFISYYLFIISIIIIKTKRDKKGRFTGKDDDNRGYQFTIAFPSIRNIIFWVLIIIIVSPWTLIL